MQQKLTAPRNALDIRPYTSNDEAFLYATWLRSYKTSSYFAKRIRNAVFYKQHAAVIKHILNKPTTKVFVASPKDDHDTILGYLACEPGKNAIAHFVYVKEDFRNMGIARALFLAAEIIPDYLTFTHWTHPLDALVDRFDSMIYDPYSL